MSFWSEYMDEPRAGNVLFIIGVTISAVAAFIGVLGLIMWIGETAGPWAVGTILVVGGFSLFFLPTLVAYRFYVRENNPEEESSA